jgi:hypothetical protein
MYIWALNRLNFIIGCPMTRLFLAILVILPFLAACAQLPESMQPLRIYDAIVRGEKLEDEKSDPPPGLDDPYPELSDVPKRPEPVLTIEEQKRLQQELEGERRKAIETDKALRERTS